jgi:cobalt/nickel transport protein
MFYPIKESALIRHRKIWASLLLMAVLSPVGIFLPRIFGAGGVWGEWPAAALEKLLGYVPERLRTYSQLWRAPLSDYTFGQTGGSVLHEAITYVLSGLAGVIIVGLVVYGISRVLVKHER